ncbi:hypothetical protein DEA8626_01982 [Defluviimonas aquaemixtae]|uniref:VWFA domain-containing protein n=1 Tax=Albidovulum aquaemixtae TaxID=1542388 RepID=A0A2R8B768_9RHOB|nr:DUF1194 domain-containing protein [Defluviimonas aquaemixtae]SPH18444.1 hypothetical protein DEA8626_01982 [Defluviimonas aquaemixtae]
MLLLLALTIALSLSSPATAQSEVDLELVLLADSSGSIDDGEIMFQRQGYATAITDPEVIAAIGNTAYGSIAVTYVEWGQFDSQDVVVPWTILDGADTAQAFAEALMNPPRRARGRNSIGAALLFGRDMIEGNNIRGWRRIIDFSGDSAGNFNGPSIGEGRRAALDAGITINGLAILCRRCASGRSGFGDLEDEFEYLIIGGPGAFVVTADGGAAFADAVKRKLILEISGRRPVATIAQAAR